MRADLTYTVQAEVGHLAAYPSWCTVPHGHTLRIAATLELRSSGLLFRQEAQEVWEPFVRALDGLRDELANRPLHEMVAPSSPDAFGVALWVHQRLLNHYRIASVTVEFAGQEARIWPE